MIIGCSAGIMTKGDVDYNGFASSTAIHYHPQGAGIATWRDKDNEFKRDGPITRIRKNVSYGDSDDVETFNKMARTRGTIFMYEKITEGDHPFFKKTYM